MKMKFYDWLVDSTYVFLDWITQRRQNYICSIKGHCHQRGPAGCLAGTKTCCYCGALK